MFYITENHGIVVERVYCGSFMTSLDMAGVSLTILNMSDIHREALSKFHREALGKFHGEALGKFHREAVGKFHREVLGKFYR